MAVEYVDDIPLDTRQDLCDLLDTNDSWEELARHIGFTVQELSSLKQQMRGDSPTHCLLKKWKQVNAKTLQLLGHLQSMSNVTAIKMLRNCVPSEAYQKAMEALDVPVDER